MIRKNKKFIDPRYFMDEKMERPLNEASIGPDNPNALLQAVERHLNQSRDVAQRHGIRADELFNTDKGFVWKALEQAGHSPDRLQHMKSQVSEFYKAGNQIELPDGSYVEITGETPQTSLRLVAQE